jgi:ubiquitin-like protein Pup
MVPLRYDAGTCKRLSATPANVDVGEPPREAFMATRDTGGQQHRTKRSTDAEEASAEAAEDLKERQEKLSDDVDAILDEIDEVLESNAEDFVRSFVQKGGE